MSDYFGIARLRGRKIGRLGEMKRGGGTISETSFADVTGREREFATEHDDDAIARSRRGKYMKTDGRRDIE